MMKRLTLIFGLILLFIFSTSIATRRLVGYSTGNINANSEKLKTKIPSSMPETERFFGQTEAFPNGDVIILQKPGHSLEYDIKTKVLKLTKDTWQEVGEVKNNAIITRGKKIVYQSAYSYTPLDSPTIIHTIIIRKGIESLQVDRDNENILYAIDQLGEIIKSVDGGNSWLTLSDISTGISDSSFELRNGLKIYSLGSNSLLFVSHKRELLISEDGGYTWRMLNYSIKGWLQDIYVDPTQRGTVYILDRMDKKLIYGSPTEDKWEEIQQFFPQRAKSNSRISLSFGHKPGILFLGVSVQSFYGTKAYLYRSLDGGKSWQSINEKGSYPLAIVNGHITAIAPVPPDDNVIYVFTEWRDVYKITLEKEK